DGDVGVVDVGVLADADARERDDAEQHRGRHQHPREDGVLDRDVGDAQGAAPGGLWPPLADPDAMGCVPPSRWKPPPSKASVISGADASGESTLFAFPIEPFWSDSFPRTTRSSPALRPLRTSTQPSLVFMPRVTTFSVAVGPWTT